MAIRKDDPGISSVLKKPLFFRKWHREPEFMTILERYLEPHEIFFDLGCNIGYVALYVLQNLNKEGFLYAIDPDPKNISALKKSIEHNIIKKKYTIENIALSSKDGEIGFEFSGINQKNAFTLISLKIIPPSIPIFISIAKNLLTVNFFLNPH